MDKRKICFVRAKAKDDYYFDAIKNGGYRIETPYKDYNIVCRCFREVHFRLKLPFRNIWYNKKLIDLDAECIIVSEMLITKEFLNWLVENNPQSKIALRYENRVNAINNPVNINGKVVAFSYDADDCEKFGMKKLNEHYLDCYRAPISEEKKYDIVFVGSDKGRAQTLFTLKEIFKSKGLNMYLRIVADRCFQRFKKLYYQKGLSYYDYLKIIGQSKAILSIVPECQKGFTLREYEVVFNGIKGITNNRHIVDFSLYDKTRYFILGVDDINNINEFLRIPFNPIDENELKPFYFDKMVEDVLDKLS